MRERHRTQEFQMLFNGRQRRRPQQQQQQHQQRQTLQCSTVSLFLCVIAAVVATSLFSSTRHLRQAINWFPIERVVASMNTNNITTNSLLIKDRLNNDNETTPLPTDVVSLQLADIPTTKRNASIDVIGDSADNNSTITEWDSNTNINSINSNQQQTFEKEGYSNVYEGQPIDQKAPSITTTTTPNATLQFQELGCLTHTPVLVKARHAKKKRSVTMLNMTFQSGCGPLRRDWRDNPPMSPMAQMILHHQSNCSLPTVTRPMDYDSGIGSHFHYWSACLCNAWERGMRLRTDSPNWIWLDHTLCDVQQAQRSPWLCYWPQSEYLCTLHEVINTSLIVQPQRTRCWRDQSTLFVKEFYNAAVEFMFRSISPLVIKEAHRQVGVVFGPNGAPPDLITVHLRWGDKGKEMKLLKVEDYIRSVAQLLHEELNCTDDNSTANIYLATEDPAAAEAFLQAAPKTWKVFVDVSVQELSPFRPPPGHLNCASVMAKNTRGRGGLVNVGAILVAMEANYYVLTSASGYSRIINRLRTQILDPRCGNCTRAIDLSDVDEVHRNH